LRTTSPFSIRFAHFAVFPSPTFTVNLKLSSPVPGSSAAKSTFASFEPYAARRFAPRVGFVSFFVALHASHYTKSRGTSAAQRRGY